MFTAIICALVVGTTIVDVAQGEYEYLPTAQLWVKPHKLVATWYEAKAQCEKEGAVLASPVNDHLLDYMQSHIGVNKHSTPYFTGIMARYEPELQFVSIEGIQVENLPTAALDSIEKLDPRDGECLAMNVESITVVPWWRRLPYVCYKNDTNVSEKTVTTTEPSYPPGHDERCESLGYHAYNPLRFPKCYKIHTDVSTWYEANKTCTKEHGHLVSIRHEVDYRQLTYILRSIKNISEFLWIGIIKEEANGDWYTVEGEGLGQLSNDFTDTEDHFSSGPVCAVMSFDTTRNGLHKLSSCTSEFSFICGKKF